MFGSGLTVSSLAKAILVTGGGAQEVCETSRLPHSLDDRLSDGEVVSLMRRPTVNPRKIPGTHFRYRLIRLKGHIATEISIDLIRNLTRDLPACIIVPQTTVLPRAPIQNYGTI
jgi:hypothetical protein